MAILPVHVTAVGGAATLGRGHASDYRGVGRTYPNGGSERIGADTPSPSLLIPVVNVPSHVQPALATA